MSVYGKILAVVLPPLSAYVATLLSVNNTKSLLTLDCIMLTAYYSAEEMELAVMLLLHVSCFESLKATNKWQRSGTGVLHQVAQHP